MDEVLAERRAGRDMACLLALYVPRFLHAIAVIPGVRGSRAAGVSGFRIVSDRWLIAFEMMVLGLLVAWLPNEYRFWMSEELFLGFFYGSAVYIGFFLIVSRLTDPKSTDVINGFRSESGFDNRRALLLLVVSFNEEVMLRGVLLHTLWVTHGAAPAYLATLVADLTLHAHQGREVMWYHLLAASISIALATNWGLSAAFFFHFANNVFVIAGAWTRFRSRAAADR